MATEILRMSIRRVEGFMMGGEGELKFSVVYARRKLLRKTEVGRTGRRRWYLSNDEEDEKPNIPRVAAAGVIMD